MLVRTLPETWAPALESIRWDGRLDNGRSAPTGLYFLQLKMPDGQSFVKRTAILR